LGKQKLHKGAVALARNKYLIDEMVSGFHFLSPGGRGKRRGHLTLETE